MHPVALRSRNMLIAEVRTLELGSWCQARHLPRVAQMCTLLAKHADGDTHSMAAHGGTATEPQTPRAWRAPQRQIQQPAFGPQLQAVFRVVRRTSEPHQSHLNSDVLTRIGRRGPPQMLQARVPVQRRPQPPCAQRPGSGIAAQPAAPRRSEPAHTMLWSR